MGEIAERVDALLTTRRERLPAVRTEIVAWQRVDAAVVTLAEAVSELRRHRATPARLAADLGQLRIAEVRPAITAVIEPLQQVERRIGRDRICIGIGGAGRSGKSTVAQSLSGLTDSWLPTGPDGPVTAVRTRVLHSPGRRRAVLTPHTAESFRAAHLAPRPPRGRLRGIQTAQWSYDGLLDRHGRPIELAGDDIDRLREYVTHPPPQVGREAAPRQYLAVKEARIECAFPHADASDIEIVDLPWLGGSAEADRHHIAGLRHDVDLVLLVKRRTGDTAHWNASDDAALALLDEARGCVGRRDDFVLVVVNASANRSGHREGRGSAIHGGTPPLRVLEVDGRSPADVSKRLLRPVLQHLTDRLPTMDADVCAGTRALTGPVRDQVIELAVATKVAIEHACDPTAVANGDLYRRADELHATMASALRAVLARVRSPAGELDRDFLATAGRVHQEIVGWIRDGFGVGYDMWCAAARRAMLRGGDAREFARTELGRARAEIDRRYRALNALLTRRLEQLWTDLAGATRHLLRDRNGAAALARLGELAAGAARPCPVLRTAVADLLAVRLDYDTHLSPRLRPDLTTLEIDVCDRPASGAGIEELHRVIAERVEEAAARVIARLRKEAALPGWIILSAAERFIDAIVGAEREVRQLARSYRHELWPGVYRGLDVDDVMVRGIVLAADDLLAATSELGR